MLRTATPYQASRPWRPLVLLFGWLGAAAACGDGGADASTEPASALGEGSVGNGTMSTMSTMSTTLGATGAAGHAMGAVTGTAGTTAPPAQPADPSNPAMGPRSSAAGAGAHSAAPADQGQPNTATAGATGMATGVAMNSAGSANMRGGAGSAAMGGAAACQDSCPLDAGVAWKCKLRFMYGVNYAWHTFAADFGGNRAWGQPGVSEEPAIEGELRMMAANGIDVVRWWLWPDFRGDGVSFDDSDTPTGLAGTALADIARALELAEQNDMYLMLTLFSFDNFRPTRMDSGVRVRGIQPLVLDDAKRRALLDNVVAPLAAAVAGSPYASRVIAWDIVNEPEWAITGPSLYGGDPEFDPMPDLESVTHAQMESFVRAVLETLRAHSDALVTVGGSAIKWAHAWSQLDLDFHQFHMYDWVNMYWPYDQSPMQYGLDDKPVVMGEFPINGLSEVSYTTLVESWFGNGYGGALGWAYTDGEFNDGDYSAIKAFSDARACETSY